MAHVLGTINLRLGSWRDLTPAPQLAVVLVLNFLPLEWGFRAVFSAVAVFALLYVAVKVDEGNRQRHEELEQTKRAEQQQREEKEKENNAEMERVKKRLHDTKQSLRQAQSDHQAVENTEERMKFVKLLDKEHDRLVEMSWMRRQTVAAQHAAEEHRLKMEAAVNKYEAREAELQRLQKEAAQATVEIARSAEEAEKTKVLATKLEASRARQKEMQLEIASFKVQLAEKDKELASAHMHVEGAIRNMEGKREKQLRDEVKSVRYLQMEKKALRSVSEALQDQLAGQDEMMGHLHENFIEHEERIAELEEELKNAREEIDMLREADRKRASDMRTADKKKEKTDKMNSQIDDLSLEVASLQAEKERLQIKVRKYDELDAHSRTLSEQVQFLVNKLAEEKKLTEEIQEKYKNSERARIKLQIDVARAEQEQKTNAPQQSPQRPKNSAAHCCAHHHRGQPHENAVAPPNRPHEHAVEPLNHSQEHTTAPPNPSHEHATALPNQLHEHVIAEHARIHLEHVRQVAAHSPEVPDTPPGPEFE